MLFRSYREFCDVRFKDPSSVNVMSLGENGVGWLPGPALPPHVELLHLSPDAAQVGRTYPTRLGLVGDPRATLEALLPLVRERVDAALAPYFKKPVSSMSWSSSLTYLLDSGERP